MRLQRVPLYFPALIVLAVAFVFLLYCFFLLFWPIQVVKMEKANALPVDRKVASPGGQVKVRLRFERLREAEVRTVRQLVCRSDIFLLKTPDDPTRRYPVGRFDQLVTYDIPETTTDDRCYILLLVDYDISPLRTVHYRFQSESFDVRGPVAPEPTPTPQTAPQRTAPRAPAAPVQPAPQAAQSQPAGSSSQTTTVINEQPVVSPAPQPTQAPPQPTPTPLINLPFIELPLPLIGGL